MNLLAASMIASTFYLHAGDRVVFYGDSITEQRLYTTYVEAFVATRYPGLNVEFFNRGWAGDSSWGGGGGVPEERVRRDVVPLKPTAVVVLLGMNDGGYVPVDPKIEAVIHDWYPKVLDLLSPRGSSIRLTLARTSPWDDFAHHYNSVGKPPEPWAPWKGYNDVLRTYGEIAEREAKTRNGIYVDFNVPLSQVLIRAAAEDPVTAATIIPDAIHPGPAGHLVMAGELLKAWNVDPVVSELTIDALSARVVEANRTSISEFKGLAWKQMDRSLPFNMNSEDNAIHLANKISGFDEQLNRQILRVKGLDAGNYQLLIDGKAVSTFRSEVLEQGVNLATIDTPMRRQSQKVFELCHRRAEVEFFAWRSVQRENGDLPHTHDAYRSLSALCEDLRDKIKQTAQPRQHTFSLKRI